MEHVDFDRARALANFVYLASAAPGIPLSVIARSIERTYNEPEHYKYGQHDDYMWALGSDALVKNQQWQCELARAEPRRKRRGQSWREGVHRQWRETGVTNICHTCMSTKNMVIDHRMSLSNGGTNKLENLQPLCHRCNVAKGKIPFDIGGDSMARPWEVE